MLIAHANKVFLLILLVVVIAHIGNLFNIKVEVLKMRDKINTQVITFRVPAVVRESFVKNYPNNLSDFLRNCMVKAINDPKFFVNVQFPFFNSEMVSAIQNYIADNTNHNK